MVACAIGVPVAGDGLEERHGLREHHAQGGAVDVEQVQGLEVGAAAGIAFAPSGAHAEGHGAGGDLVGGQVEVLPFRGHR
ncbi:hypothetical protein D3C78_1676720 [compost metagenome]